MYPQPKIDLSVEFCGVKFAHPFILAAAPPTDDLDMVRDAFRLGWAGAVLKTTSIEGTPVNLAYPMMSGVDLEDRRLMGMGNIDLISEHHVDVVEKRIAVLKSEFPDCRVISSISGQDKESWQTVTGRVRDAGADMIECSFSCPQGSLGLKSGAMLGQDPVASAKVVDWIKSAAGAIPVIIKLTPQVNDIAEVARAVAGAGADAVCVGNTLPALMGIDWDEGTGRDVACRSSLVARENSQLTTENGKPKDEKTPCGAPKNMDQRTGWVPIPNVGGKSTYSGLSGPAIKPISLRCVSAVAKVCGIPIAASGGAVTWRDALEFILLGATVVEFCTAVMHYGFDIVEDLKEGLGFHLERLGISKVSELTGVALEKIVPHDELPRGIKWRPSVDKDACVVCDACMIACRDGGHRAITADALRYPIIDDEKCVGCALCSTMCPAFCIEMKQETSLVARR